MSSEIVVALIGGAAGLVSGTIGSLIAPWSQWGVERHRLRRQRRAELLAEWRRGVDGLREVESGAAVTMRGPSIPGRTENVRMILDDGRPDPDEANVNRHQWFLSLKPHLSADVTSEVDELVKTRIVRRSRDLPGLLAEEIVKIEKKWNLI
ncbi:hypothetical protein NJBCHELONAE_19260 [Mycobacteroides chelonae]|uniref:hypothetical protein n=1 Tax=Mycobacteroides chelonae TaxID=1774 RepID=UPI002230B78A|nr:hypothetical protein [Mycobacteroides chelonae]GLE56617.1 hypothetical protein NJBCHELONAE_19260 [Mycobacteroides chelonae]